MIAYVLEFLEKRIFIFKTAEDSPLTMPAICPACLIAPQVQTFDEYLTVM